MKNPFQIKLKKYIKECRIGQPSFYIELFRIKNSLKVLEL